MQEVYSEESDSEIQQPPQEPVIRADVRQQNCGNAGASPDAFVKTKRQITEAQREHLNKIRQLALEKKRQMKETTLKAKLAKTVEKEDLAKKYDEYVSKKIVQPDPPKIQPQKPKKVVKKIYESESEEEVEEIIVKKKKPVKKIKKKIIYESSESESEEEQVVVKKKPSKKPLQNLVYDNTKQELHNRIMEERVRSSIMGYANALGI
jgi:hypothetical protein